MATVHCCNRAQLCVCKGACYIQTSSTDEMFLREGESWQAASKFQKLAFDCIWLQLKQSKSVFDGKPKTRQKMSYYLCLCLSYTVGYISIWQRNPSASPAKQHFSTCGL